MKNIISALITLTILLLISSCSTPPPPGTKFNLSSDDPYRQGQNLVEAIAHGANSAAYRLMEQGAPLNYQDKKDKWTPLIYAIYHHNWRMSKVIIRAGANVNLADSANRTPLMWAALRNCGVTAKLLVEYGADINAVDLNGRTALQYAVIYTNYTLAAYLAEAGRHPDSQRLNQEQLERMKTKLARQKAEEKNLEVFGDKKKREVIAEIKKDDINKTLAHEDKAQAAKKNVSPKTPEKPSPTPPQKPENETKNKPTATKKITVTELINKIEKQEKTGTESPSSTTQDTKNTKGVKNKQ